MNSTRKDLCTGKQFAYSIRYAQWKSFKENNFCSSKVSFSQIQCSRTRPQLVMFSG